MAANFSNRAFNFESQTELAERKKVWNNNEVEIRFLFECDWIKEVRLASGGSNYGLGNRFVVTNWSSLVLWVDSSLFENGKHVSYFSPHILEQFFFPQFMVIT